MAQTIFLFFIEVKTTTTKFVVKRDAVCKAKKRPRAVRRLK